jgi:hypothetical protein
MGVKITISSFGTRKKPLGSDYRKLHYSLYNMDMSITMLRDLITGEEPRNWSPNFYALSQKPDRAGHFTIKRTNNDWRGSQGFAFDFDENGLDPKIILQKFRSIGIEPNIIYGTWSDKPDWRKFRVVIFHDTLQLDGVEQSIAQMKWMQWLGSVDPSCSDLARFYNGGPTLLHFSEELNSWDVISAHLGTIVLPPSHTGTYNAKDNVDWDEWMPPGDISDWDWIKARRNVRLLNGFFTIGKNHVEGKYHILKGLATNLRWIQGGLKEIRKVMLLQNEWWKENGSKNRYDRNDFKLLLGVSKKAYSPQRLFHFNPDKWAEDNHWHNIVNAGLPETKVKISPQPPGKPAKEIIDEMKGSFDELGQRLREEGEKFIWLFQVDTAIGKTTELLKRRGLKMAFPDHNILSEKMLAAQRIHDDVQQIWTPKTPEFHTTAIQSVIDELWGADLGEVVREYYKVISKGGDVACSNGFMIKPNTTDIQIAKDYIGTNANFYKEISGVGSVGKQSYTTHWRAIYDFQVYNEPVWFDENPIRNIVKFGDCEPMKWIDSMPPEFSDFVNDIKAYWDSLKPGKFYSWKSFGWNSEKWYRFVKAAILTKNKPLIHFIRATHHMKGDDGKAKWIVVLKDELLDQQGNLKNHMVILSATPTPKIWQKLFPDKVKIVKLSDVEPKGKNIQWIKRNWSRNMCKALTTEEWWKFGEHLKSLGVKYVITYADEMQRFKNMGFNANGEVPHIMNASATNSLIGRRIAVVGNPLMPADVYLLWGRACGLPINDLGFDKLGKNTVKRGHLSWQTITFSNPDLQDIFFDLNEEHLIQAVGRSRNNVVNVDTHIFSGHPLCITTDFKNDKYL